MQILISCYLDMLNGNGYDGFNIEEWRVFIPLALRLAQNIGYTLMNLMASVRDRHVQTFRRP